MKTKNEFPETLQETITFFSDEEKAFAFVRSIRWENGVATCPRCESKKSYFLPSRRMWKCKGCSHKFGVRFGTIFQDSPLPLGKWMTAFWILVNAKNGVSSYELHRSIGVTQKTAWFMLGRIRLAIQNGSIIKMSGTCEVDESWIGGSARNMHKAKKAKVMKGCQNTALTPVMGLLERGTRDKCSRIRTQIIRNTSRKELHGHVRKYVLKGAEVHTDALFSYRGLDADYTHKVVDHAVAYVQDGVHTNGLENFWSLLKRSIKGTYVHCASFHLFRYLDEQTYRFNERKGDDQSRFVDAVQTTKNRRLTWKKLTGKSDLESK